PRHSNIYGRAIPSQALSDKASVRVAVMMVVVRADGLKLRRSAAAMGGLAAASLELNRGVVDVEALAESAVDGFKNAAALRPRHLRNGHMAGQRARLRAQRPDAKIVDVDHAGNRLHGVAHCAELNIARRAF